MRTHYLISAFAPFGIMLAAAACWSLPVQAGTMYKCTEGGRTTYTDAPCATGRVAALAVEEAPPPDPELAARLARQRALAQDIDARNAAQAAGYEQEARYAGRRDGLLERETRQYCAQLREQHKAIDAEEQRAILEAPGTRKGLERARARENWRQRDRVMAERCRT